MPQYKNPFERGRLLVQFQVKFPESNWLPPQQLPKLESYLPPREETIIPDDAEECVLQQVDPNDENQKQQRRKAYDSDDENGRQGQSVQCATH